MRKTLSFAAAVMTFAAYSLPAVAEAPAGEQFRTPTLAGWQTQQPVKQGNITMVTMIPPGATPQDATEAVRVMREEGSKHTPKEFVDEAIATNRKNCEGLQVGPIDEAPINGYKAASIRLACTKSAHNGKSGLLGITAIAGKDALHVQQLIWFGPAVGANQAVPVPNDTIKAWDVMMGNTFLCDSRDAKHPCAKEGKK